MTLTRENLVASSIRTGVGIDISICPHVIVDKRIRARKSRDGKITYLYLARLGIDQVTID